MNAGLTSWADPTWTNVGFVYVVDSSTPVGLNPTSSDNSYKFPKAAVNAATSKTDSLPNRLKAGPEATTTLFFAAAPNSNHPGGVNVSWCDGAVGFISDTIDTSVYARLISPGGARNRTVGGITPQDPLGDNSY